LTPKPAAGLMPMPNNPGWPHNIHDHQLKPATGFGTSPVTQ
jgi:hypothetical protein